LLANGETLPPANRDHDLRGNWAGYRECHITPDWILICKITGGELFLYLERTGTHSDLLE
jgi:mRNA interferase YafQ